MTTKIYATRADRLPVGLCWIAAHGDCPGGLAWKSRDQHIDHVEAVWHLSPYELADHWGDAMVAIPRDLAEASTDTAVVAWVKSNINTSKEN